MYKVGDLIVYGNYGVFKVEAVDTLEFSGVDKNKLYYSLSSLYSSETIFTPVDTNVFMRPVITCDEAKELIFSIPSIKAYEHDNYDMKLMEEYYQKSIQTHDCLDLLKLIKVIYIKERKTGEKGKKLGIIDKRYMQKAENLLYGEFAVALGIQKENVKSYIEERVKEQENNDLLNNGGMI